MGLPFWSALLAPLVFGVIALVAAPKRDVADAIGAVVMGSFICAIIAGILLAMNFSLSLGVRFLLSLVFTFLLSVFYIVVLVAGCSTFGGSMSFR